MTLAGFYSLIPWIVGFLVVYVLFRANTPIGKPMRFDPALGGPLGERWYMQSKPDSGAVHSCSFVEFDGRGDYIDFAQHKHAWEKVGELAKQQPLLLVLYCHGWKNNSQSSDVVKFNDFLGRLAASDTVANLHYRVHGVYLGWRGNLYRPFIEKDDELLAYARTCKLFGEPVVSPKWSRPSKWTRSLLKTRYRVFPWPAPCTPAPLWRNLSTKSRDAPSSF
jgi:hypothetical protein